MYKTTKERLRLISFLQIVIGVLGFMTLNLNKKLLLDIKDPNLFYRFYYAADHVTKV